MSATESSESDGYHRDGWWGEPEVSTVADKHHEEGIEWADTEIRDEKAASVAHKILRGAAPALC